MLAEATMMIAGLLLGQTRTLQRLGWLANLAIWLNVVVIFMTMAVVSEYVQSSPALTQVANRSKHSLATARSC